MENNFEKLVNIIQDTHTTLQQNALKSINKHLTIRNWLIGFYIVEFEQNGEDRARYGEELLQKLADSLKQSSLSYRNLKLFRQFYFTYPAVGSIVSAQLRQLSVLPSTTDSLKVLATDNQSFIIGQSANAQFDQEKSSYSTDANQLISNLSFTHLVQLFPINNPVKRAFYETESIKGNWSVSELKRQINTLF